ncbi:histone-like nucleoid-structuring protein Lsr2 [Streptomyces sp. NPDC000987]|uniref:Lsr2 dimerization domain-containing protein n=1 Tax=Streptomyces sp. NPDC000987 TaxID=3154374 RepID=UPI00333010A2
MTMAIYPRDAFDQWIPADETVFFSLDDADYAINLTAGGAAGLREKLAPFLEKARKVGETSIGELRANLDAELGFISGLDVYDPADPPLAITRLDVTPWPDSFD